MSNNKSILIVEDDKLLSFVEERLIKKLGYELAGKATNGEDAIKVAKETRPDLIIMDVNLESTMDGIQSMQHIREFSDVPVVFLSGDSKKETEGRLQKIDNWVDYLVKPVNADDLRKPLQKAFNAPFKNTSHAKSA